jgi:hypothetical protein
MISSLIFLKNEFKCWITDFYFSKSESIFLIMVSNLTMLHHLHHFWLFSSFILVPIRLINPITLIVFTISIVINIIIGSSISLVKINKIYNSTSDNNHCIMMYHIETSFPGFSFCLTCWWHTFKFSDGQHCRDHSHNIKLENLTQSLDVQYNNLQVFIHLSHPMKPVPLLPPTATWRRPLPADPQRQLLTLNG